MMTFRLSTLLFLLLSLALLGVPASSRSAQSAIPLAVDPAVVQQVVPAPMPSWFVDERPSQDAWAALDVLSNAASQGLDPLDYRAHVLALAFRRADQTAPSPDIQAQLDAELTTALERYLADLNHGRLSPEVLRHRFKVSSTHRFDPRAYLVQARQSGNLAEALNAAQPRVPMYESIRAVMNGYRAMGDHPAWQLSLPPLPERSLKPGQTYAGVPLIAARLAALGDLAPDIQVGQRYEGAVVDAIRDFQTRHGLEPDGIIGQATITELNVSPAQRVRQMALTLERLRWTPLLYGQRMIVVNIPEFVLRAYELQGDEIQPRLEMRVVVGRALDTRTPIFMEDMRFIEFSPYWNVPRSIARNETLPRLRRDPGYFSRQGFEFVTREGAVVRNLSGEAIDAVERGEWRIRQRPGPRNALGDIKFIFPNDQAIFLHHTPAPELFARARRDFSHGCIRIEHPVDLARFVLKNQPEWTTERIQEAMGSGRSRTLRLAEPVPVLIAYSTAVAKEDGKVYFFSDIYQQDARLERALRDARPTHS